MPKIKGANKEVSKDSQGEKIIEVETEERDRDIELIQGVGTEDEELDDDSMLDDDEVDPFKDKWEE